MTHLLMNLGRGDAGNSANANLLYGSVAQLADAVDSFQLL